MLKSGVIRHGARTLAIVFLAVTVPTAATLIWLALRLVDQDRTLWAQRELDRRQQEAEAAVRTLQDRLHAWLNEPQPHSLRIDLAPRSLVADDVTRLLWLPVIARTTAAVPTEFFELESREIRGQAEEALTGYLQLAQSADRTTAAGALQRAARVYRARRDWEEALAAYRRMATFGDTWLESESMPADLLARRAICNLLDEIGRTHDLAVAAEALAAEFEAGRWRIDGSGWELAREDIERWTGRTVLVEHEARVLSAATAALWRDWTEGQWRSLRGERSRVITVDGVPVTIVERQDERGARAAMLLPEAVRAALAAVAPGDPVSVLHGEQVLAGPGITADRGVARVQPGDTGLPWTIAVSPGTWLQGTSLLRQHFVVQ